MKNIYKFFCLFILLLITLTGCIQNQNQPNIVWLVAEDQSQHFFSYYGDQSVNLPNINILLDNGVVYDQMNSPYPVCAPARSGIITGMSISNTLDGVISRSVTFQGTGALTVGTV